MSQSLKNKVALITGGTTGIGFATAKRFIDEGAVVVLTGRNPETLAAAQSELGDSAHVIKSDAANEEDVKRLFADVQKEHGLIDILFLNAGIARFAPWEHHSLEDFEHQFAVNVKGPWLAIKHGMSALRDGASVIATTSAVTRMRAANTSAYAATKGALMQLVRVAAAELSHRNIRVNAVSPGPIETPIFGKVGVPQEQLDEMANGFTNQVLLGRIGQSAEVANLVSFLASEQSSYIQGQELVVDGGISV